MKKLEMRVARAAVVISAMHLVGLAANPALAYDAPKPPTPVASWSQFYTGAGLGFDFATGRSSLAPIGGPAAFNFTGLQGADLGMSAFAGIDVQVGSRFVVGGFLDYDWSNQKSNFSAVTSWMNFSASLPSLDQGWTVGGRAGVLVSPDVLLYGLAGFSEMKLNNWGITYTPPKGTDFRVQEAKLTARGYTVGFGAEYRLANNVSLRGEYRYVGLGSNTTVDTQNGATWTTDLSEHVVRISAAYRFGQFGTNAPAAAPATPALKPSWTGFYVGAGIGGDAIAPHVEGTVPAADLAINGSGLGGADVGGTFMLGYDRQIVPNLVVGAFGLIDIATNGGVKFSASAVGGDALTSDMAAVNWGWTVGGRVGYLVSPQTLVYLLGGYSGTTLHSVTYGNTGLTATGPTPEYHGATFGGGFERFFTDTISARAEYRVTHLGTLDNLTAPMFDRLSAGGTVHTLRGVLAYHLPTP